MGGDGGARESESWLKKLKSAKSGTVWMFPFWAITNNTRCDGNRAGYRKDQVGIIELHGNTAKQTATGGRRGNITIQCGKHTHIFCSPRQHQQLSLFCCC